MQRAASDWMIEPLRRYAQFGGRARRKEYWWFQVFAVIVWLGLGALDRLVFGAEAFAELGISGPFSVIGALGFAIPNLAVSVRRLHDRDQSGWWLLISLLPLIGGLVLLYWLFQPGTRGSNRFGPDPHDS